jgi:hypothetical protein
MDGVYCQIFYPQPEKPPIKLTEFVEKELLEPLTFTPLPPFTIGPGALPREPVHGKVTWQIGINKISHELNLLLNRLLKF